MKKHAIIPIFIPHDGCPNDCVFCNQRVITARSHIPTAADVYHIVSEHLKTLTHRGLETVEIAFYGGSFTGIPIKQQTEYLRVAKKFKDAGQIDRIHLSTRPDYIDEAILRNLKEWGVDIIELGVQSLDEEVLKLSGRGHDARIVYQSAALIRQYGFTLGIQLMIGLPGDAYEKDLYSARETVKIGPTLARLYPTVILRGTKLYEMYEKGIYHPLSQAKAIRHTKDMYAILQAAGIQVIRIGLKSTDLVQENGEATAGGTFHPAFRQLVEGELAKESLASKLSAYLAAQSQSEEGNLDGINAEETRSELASLAETNSRPDKAITFFSNNHCFSNLVGHQKANRRYFEAKYPQLRFHFRVDPCLPDGVYELQVDEPSAAPQN